MKRVDHKYNLKTKDVSMRRPYFYSKTFQVAPWLKYVDIKSDGERRWEDLDSDNLANVFNRVGMKTLVLAIPFVCKSWYRASLNPLSWQRLVFPKYEPLPLFLPCRTSDENVDEDDDDDDVGHFILKPFYAEFAFQNGVMDHTRFSITRFVKLIIDRSKGKVTELRLPTFFNEEGLRYVSDACPLLKDLAYCDDLMLFKHALILPEVIGKWKLLESLTLFSRSSSCIDSEMRFECPKYNNLDKKRLSKHFKALLTETSPKVNVLHQLLVQIGIHCKHFKHLDVYSIHRLGEVEASTIVTLLPNLRSLRAISCGIEPDSIWTILGGCKELELFYLKICKIFGGGGDETLQLASKNDNFECFGCDEDDKFFHNSSNVLRNMIWYLANKDGRVARS